MSLKKYIWMLSVLIIPFSGISQEKPVVNKKTFKKAIREGDYYFRQGFFFAALPIYDSLLHIHAQWPGLNYKAGLSAYYSSNDKQYAIRRFKRALEEKQWEASFFLARSYHYVEMIDSALFYYNLFESSVKEPEKVDLKQFETCYKQSKRAQEMMNNPERISIRNMGEHINSEYDDYTPVINAENSLMFFTSRRKGGVGSAINAFGDFYEDIYQSNNINGRWSEPVNVGSPLNTEKHDAVVGINPEGSHLILFRTGDSEKNGNLFHAEMSDSTWPEPVLLGEPVNSKYAETSATYSHDANEIYFSSNRPDGYGGKDLYRVKHIGGGKWSEAQNLGPKINSSADEDSPFIHPNNKTLYFSSTGHDAIGGFDIFKSEKDDSDKWGNPVNMGFPVNSVHNDVFFVLTADGKRGYFSSKRKDSYGGQDLYQINLEGPTSDVIMISTKVNGESGEKIPVSLTVYKPDGDVHGIYQTSGKKDHFLIILSQGLKYEFVIQAKGYLDMKGELYFNQASDHAEKQYLMKKKE